MRLVGFSFTDLFNAFSNAELLLDKESSQSNIMLTFIYIHLINSRLSLMSKLRVLNNDIIDQYFRL